MSADSAPSMAAPSTARVASLGISTTAICGVRDHGALLAPALAHEGWDCTTLWLDREGDTLAAARAQVDAWARALPAQLAESRADVALLHYSVFAYSFRGLPLFAHPVLAAVRRAGVPLVTLLHEFVYPWGRDGLRGAAWAVSQRALLIDVMRASGAVVTTTDFQADWLASRRWLPRRTIGTAPVFSNLPPPSPAPAPAPGSPSAPEHDGATIGLFGYGYGPAPAALVARALRLLQDRGVRVHLRLLGAPGRDSPAGGTWLGAAREAGLRAAAGVLRRARRAAALGCAGRVRRVAVRRSDRAQLAQDDACGLARLGSAGARSRRVASLSRAGRRRSGGDRDVPAGGAQRCARRAARRPKPS